MSMTHLAFAPRGVFRGRNFMTPDVRGYYKITMGAQPAYIEISEGRGFSNNTIFGVTVRDRDGNAFSPDPSTVADTYHSALNYAEGLADNATAIDNA